jgi:hypothetical protein
MNKREFVWSAGAALAVCAARSAMAGAEVPAGFRDWQRRVGQSFSLAWPSARARLVLHSVTLDHADRPGEQFTLRFTATAGAMPLTGTHELRDGSGERTAMYLQDAGLNAEGAALCRAHFCRMTA